MNSSLVYKKLESFSKIASCIAILTGTVVFISWSLGLQFMTDVFPNFFVMKPNTALCFVLAGVAQWLLQRQPGKTLEGPQSQWGFYFSLIFGAIGFLTLMEYNFHADLGIDQFIFFVGQKNP